jgi:hypothetical protein
MLVPRRPVQPLAAPAAVAVFLPPAAITPLVRGPSSLGAMGARDGTVDTNVAPRCVTPQLRRPQRVDQRCQRLVAFDGLSPTTRVREGTAISTRIYMPTHSELRTVRSQHLRGRCRLPLAHTLLQRVRVFLPVYRPRDGALQRGACQHLADVRNTCVEMLLSKEDILVGVCAVSVNPQREAVPGGAGRQHAVQHSVAEEEDRAVEQRFDPHLDGSRSVRPQFVDCGRPSRSE